jgi:hypothetical protein
MVQTSTIVAATVGTLATGLIGTSPWINGSVWIVMLTLS